MGGGWGRLVCVLLPTPTPPQGFPLHFNSAAMHVRFLDFTSRFDFPYSDSVILAMTRSFVVRLWGHCGRGHFLPLVSQIGVLWLQAVTHGQKLTEFEGERDSHSPRWRFNILLSVNDRTKPDQTEPKQKQKSKNQYQEVLNDCQTVWRIWPQ